MITINQRLGSDSDSVSLGSNPGPPATFQVSENINKIAVCLKRWRSMIFVHVAFYTNRARAPFSSPLAKFGNAYRSLRAASLTVASASRSGVVLVTSLYIGRTAR